MHYVGLDVSLKQTSICVVSETGSVVREGVVDSEPEAIAAFVKSIASNVARIGLETGPTSTWLWTELKQLGLPVICIDARHAKAVLKMQINKSDRNDAVGIARIMQTGWFREVRVKDLDSHALKALLASRALLVKIKRDLENQVRGLLKNLGLVIGRAKFNVFAARAEELIEDRPQIVAAIRPLLDAREGIEQQIDQLDRKVLKLARNDVQVRRFMTVPGVGPITALCFKATIDDPTRFKRSRSVGAYVGLTTRRHASGEIDWSGRISKCGDAMLRMYLFEAAGVLLTRVPKWSGLKAWGAKLTKRNGLRKAKVAVARKLAVILHRMWIDGTEFNWSTKKAAA
jgi:transposase